MSKITIKVQYAPHSEGTKFYMAMLVTHDSNAYVIKVHGPIGAKGRVIHESHKGSMSVGVTEYSKIINAKSKRGYMFREVLNEVVDYTLSPDAETNLNTVAADLAKKLIAKTASSSGYASELLTALKSVTAGSDITFEAVSDEPLLKEPFRAGPKVEPVRKEDWGSW